MPGAALSLVDYSPAGVAAIEELNREMAQKCVDRMGKDVPCRSRNRFGRKGYGRRP